VKRRERYYKVRRRKKVDDLGDEGIEESGLSRAPVGGLGRKLKGATSEAMADIDVEQKNATKSSVFGQRISVC
jgi:hypothetical protein